MTPRLVVLLLMFLTSAAFCADSSNADATQQRANDLKAYIKKEKAEFDLRENQKRGLLESLDELNSKQNYVRQKLLSLHSQQQELQMSLDNLALEVQNQKKLERLQRQRLFLLLKVVYKIQKEGMIRYVFYGHNLSQLAGRMRVLYHTLRSHTLITRQFEERAIKLAETELKLKESKQKLSSLFNELQEQQVLLSSLLKNKRQLVTQINQKQSSYQLAVKEYKRISSQVTKLFSNLPSAKTPSEPEPTVAFEPRGDWPFPVQGKIIQGFGKSVHEKFKTVTYHKGIEIEADFNAPVSAIKKGIVEFAGWLRGLGNVMILHHGGGLYTLNAHLFKFNKAVGDSVEQSEIIGFVGDTGNNDKPSLYFELRQNGKAVDPIAYLTNPSTTALN
jgi:septal ring factor EnvC (AmiA/AmiB activator)